MSVKMKSEVRGGNISSPCMDISSGKMHRKVFMTSARQVRARVMHMFTVCGQFSTVTNYALVYSTTMVIISQWQPHKCPHVSSQGTVKGWGWGNGPYFWIGKPS